ncbi:MAG: OadG family protein [Spirochaetales bacterium]
MAGGIGLAGQAAGIGMAIVFAFLTFMSLLMLALRSLDRLARKPGAAREIAASGAQSIPASGSAASPPSKKIPEWAIAAALVYLEAERERERHSASAWTDHRFGGQR